ncbi:MAG: hypothetical protein ACYC26_10490 [Phycisphaerales bacterium]
MNTQTETPCLTDWTNTVQCLDCVQGMRQLPDHCVDLVVTSPPYDQVRTYNGFEYDLHATGEQIFRVLKDGGVAAMVIQDQTANFGKSLTSFRTIIDWCDNIGFKLFECVIYIPSLLWRVRLPWAYRNTLRTIRFFTDQLS